MTQFSEICRENICYDFNVTEEVEHSHRVENGKVLEEGQLTEQEHVWQRPGVSQVEPHRK